jgi:Flp pilus assembly pilin Flp
MLSRLSTRWRWFDWIALAIAVIVVVGAIRIVAPTSGLSQSLHQGFHALAIGLQWIASGLSALAQLLGQL